MKGENFSILSSAFITHPSASTLLVIHQGALGDVVITFPALLELKRRFSRIDAFLQSSIGKIAYRLGIIDKFFPIEARSFSSLYSESVDEEMRCLLRSYDEIIIFSESSQMESAVFSARNRTACRILPRPESSARIHVADHIFNCLIKSGFLESTSKEISNTQNSLYKIKNETDKKKIFIHPGSGSRKKNWQLSYFIRLYEELKSEGLYPEFMLGPAEFFMANDMPANVNVISDLNHLVSLLKTGGGFIGNDSGVSHLAAFLGVPTVAIFGPSDPIRWSPRGKAVKVVRGATECQPCFETPQRVCDTPECLTTISPEMVLKLFLQVKQSKITDDL